MRPNKRWTALNKAFMTAIRLHPAVGHYAEIGQMVVSFQSLEATMKYFLLLLVSDQVADNSLLARAVLNELSFAALLRATESASKIFGPNWFASRRIKVRTLVEEDHVAALKNIADGVKMARSVEERRNQLIHSEWLSQASPPTDPGTILRAKASKRGDPGELKVSAETIESILNVSTTAKESEKLLVLGLSELLRLRASSAFDGTGESTA